jgi:hydrogenase expression/formation protein HypD
MKYIDEFRDPALLKALLREIGAASAGRRVRLMEICGGHTHAIYRFGLHELLPAAVELVHGPGCPVCVLPRGRIDMAVDLARRPGVTLATFGDMLRVPGSRGSLLDAQAAGADVRMVYSPLDVLDLARAEAGRQVVFFAIGFETTTPGTALLLRRARDGGVANLRVFCNHVLVIPAVRALLGSGAELDGFIGPGHVSAILGSDAWAFLPREFGKAVAISGFEPLDLLQAVLLAVRQVVAGRPAVDVPYARAVRPEGNRKARAAVEEVFEERPEFAWRGLATIPRSALRIREAYAAWDAERRFGLADVVVPDPPVCRCGDVLRGIARPWECAAFGTACTPDAPIGACMVSNEGACAAVYQYGRYAGPVTPSP